MNERVSVIVPVYNMADMLVKCLDSIKRQTYTNIEVIVVNDGSTDGSREIAEQYAKADSRFKIVHHEVNKGIACGFISGITNSTGRYVVFVDSDNYISETMIERLVELKESTQADVVQGDALCYEDESEIQNIQEKDSVITVLDTKKDIIEDFLLKKHITNNLSVKLFNREWLKNVEIPEGRQVVDITIMLQIVDKCSKYVCTNAPLYYAYMAPNSISRGAISERRISDMEYANEFYMKLITTRWPEYSNFTNYRTADMALWAFLKICESKDITNKRQLKSKYKRLFADNYHNAINTVYYNQLGRKVKQIWFLFYHLPSLVDVLLLLRR